MATEKKEEVLWHGKPSQVLNVPIYALCLLGSFLIVPIFYAAWRWIELNNIEYEFTTERIFKKTGVFSKMISEVELYRIKDYTLQEPFWLRLFDLGNIQLDSSDKNLPIFNMRGLEKSSQLRDKIRMYVERLREIKKIREVDGF